MIIYLLLLLFTVGPLLWTECLFEKGKIKADKWYYPKQLVWVYLFSCFLLLIFALSRDISVGADYSRYRSHFYSAYKFSKYEPLFNLFSQIVSFFIPNFNWFSDYLLGFSLGLIFTMIYSNRGKLWVGLLFFQCTFLYVLMFSAMRQALAFAFVSVALAFLYTGKAQKSKMIAPTLLILVAALFHYSAIFGIFIIISYLIKNKFKLYIPIVIISILLLLFGGNLISLAVSLMKRQSQYLSYKADWGESTIAYLLLMIILIIAPRMFPGILKKSKNRLKMISLEGKELALFNLLTITLVFNLFYVFIPSHFRITSYFYFAIAFLYAKVFDSKRITDWLAVALTVVYYIYQLYSDVISITPYKVNFGLF